MKSCIFIGPSGSKIREKIPPEICVFEPASCGHVYQAYRLGFERILLVDGSFGRTPSVWHKEILFTLSKGVEVFGGASMGALRAAELSNFGMVGIGQIYRDYLSRKFIDDDFVCVTHGPKHLSYVSTSDAMVNIIYTLSDLRRKNLIDQYTHDKLRKWYSAKYFADRKISCVPSGVSAALRNILRDRYVDQKEIDAQQVINFCSHRDRLARPVLNEFPPLKSWERWFRQTLRYDDIVQW